jgi:transcriptional regulator with XRE-family HTH domain
VNVVYELRQRAGLTQELLAGLAGVDRSMISRYETGRRSPRLDTLQRLARAVELEVVVSFQSASPRATAESVDSGDRSAAPSDLTWTSTDQDTHNPGGGVVFTRGGEFAP